MSCRGRDRRMVAKPVSSSSGFAQDGVAEMERGTSAQRKLRMSVKPLSPTAQAIAEAARALRQGGLVAFPTETVYGLGADALEERAVQKIFAAKGRPANNPLIVHVTDKEAARALVADWPSAADRLAEDFWP